jgi:DNA-binding CsgD family transcriptional regulator
MERVPRSGQRTGLLGRSSECALLDDLLWSIRRGESRSLVLYGEAGIGKTALIEYLVASASDITVVRAAGVESEMELAYAGLHQLCAPLLERLSGLPAPQRQALEIVFGLSSRSAPDRFLVGLAVLSLLSETAEQRPLLCVIDDAQWLDQTSAVTLAFVARRLLAEPVGIVFAAREPGQELDRLPELEVRGVRNGDARALLGSAVRFNLDERVRERIIAETRGNPLALLELPKGLTATQLAGGFGLLGVQHVSGQIEQSFVRRLELLSEDARRLLLLAAAEPLGDPLLLLRAAERLGVELSVVDRETDGLLAIGERVTFRHPLVRSAVYRSVTAQERRVVHLVLAEMTDPQVDPERRAWHLAAAALGPDEEVALELERSAGRAQARGGLAAAAAFLRRAAELTAQPARRADRALAAAQAGLEAGAFDSARGLLARAETGELDEFQRARADLVRGQIALSSGAGSDAAPLLLKAAQRLESLDLDLARDTYLDALVAAALAGPADCGARLEICRAVRALPAPARDPRPIELLLDGLAILITEGRAAAAPRLWDAARLLIDERLCTGDRVRAGWLVSAPSSAMWDNDGIRTTLARQIQLVRDAGALEQLPIYLVTLATATARTGDFPAAASLIAESEEVTAATGARLPPIAGLLLGALKGRETEASTLIGATIERAADSEQEAVVAMAQYAAAVLYNGLARWEEAVAAAEHACWDPVDLYASGWALPELVEAGARCGQLGAAQAALKRLAAATHPAGTDWGLGLEARSRALLSEGAAADGLYREAIDRLGRARLRPELARAQLLYGEWLRRQSRRVDAREQLRAAHEHFVSIGMEAFAERSRRELVATGEKARKRTVDTRDDLTPQQRQIAHLARDGLSNPDIGAQLFLSPRTVEWHLGNVFGKLGIRSRHELASALPSSESELLPV